MSEYDIRHYRFLRKQPPELEAMPWKAPEPPDFNWVDRLTALVIAVLITSAFLVAL